MYLPIKLDKPQHVYLQQPLGRQLAFASRLYVGALSSIMQDVEIERHCAVLLAVHHHTEDCNQQFLANTLHIDKASMVRIIDTLSDAGYISRSTSAKDRRAHNIQLTSKGIQMLPKLQAAIQQIHEAAFTGFTASEKNRFFNALQKMSDNLIPLNLKEPLVSCDQMDS